jgi:hypothetical protein
MPILSIVRLVPWGSCGYRYVIAAGIGHPLLLRSVFRDTCETFPEHPVIVVAEYPTYCEAEAVKPSETSCGYLVCMRASGVGWLIQATVGSFGGVGGRANRAGWAA